MCDIKLTPWRIRIIAVAVTLAELAASPMDDDLAAFAPCGRSGSLDGLGLGPLDRSASGSALPKGGPAIIPLNHMNWFLHDCSPNWVRAPVAQRAVDGGPVRCDVSRLQKRHRFRLVVPPRGAVSGGRPVPSSNGAGFFIGQRAPMKCIV